METEYSYRPKRIVRVIRKAKRISRSTGRTIGKAGSYGLKATDRLIEEKQGAIRYTRPVKLRKVRRTRLRKKPFRRSVKFNKDAYRRSLIGI